MKQRITFIIVMLLTMLGSARAANTESIKVLDDYTLTLWEVDALRVLAMDQAITIESGHVIRNGVELFHFDSNNYVTKPPTTTSAHTFTHTLSASTIDQMRIKYPSLGDITSIELKFKDPQAYVVYDRIYGSLTFRYDDRMDDHNEYPFVCYPLNKGTDEPGWYQHNHSADSVIFDSRFSYARPTSCYKWFDNSGVHTIIGLNYLNTSEVTDMSYMFNLCNRLERLNLSTFDTSKVKSMRCMFNICNSLTSINLSSFKTAKVTDMGYMFSLCESLTSLDVSHFNTSKVYYMEDMFFMCSSLTSLDVSHFNVSNVLDMQRMFYKCSALTSLDLSGFKIRCGVRTNEMFWHLRSLRTLSLSDRLISLFNELGHGACSGIGSDADGNVTTPCTLIYPTTSHAEFFKITPSYVEWNGGYFVTENLKPYAQLEDGTKLVFYYDDYYDDKKATSTVYALNEGTLDPGWFDIREDITSVEFQWMFMHARPTSCYNWFMGMKNLTSIPMLYLLKTDQVTTMENMFAGCSGLTKLDVSKFNTDKVTSMAGMFYNCSRLSSLDVSKFNTAGVNNMRYMFNGCSGLTKLDLSGFTTGSGTITGAMLGNMSGLQLLTVSSSLAENMADGACRGTGTTSRPCVLTYPTGAHPSFSTMTSDYVVWKEGYFSDTQTYAVYGNSVLTFYCDNYRSTRSGTTYDLNTGAEDPEWESIADNIGQVEFDPSFANARPTSTYSWFYGMTALCHIYGMEYLNTSEVTNMDFMFGKCSLLPEVDLSHLNTDKVTQMNAMFYQCSALTSLDLSSFTTKNVTGMQQMFYQCYKLATIYVGDGWTTAGVTNSNYMFEGCFKLVGGQGTTYNEYTTEKNLAHIDGGTNDPGYFSTWLMPYAVYTPENTTLTFYYDEQRRHRPGTSYSLNTRYDDPEWYEDGTYESVTRVVFDASFAEARPTSTYSWFYGMDRLQSITGMEYLNTSKVTIMAYMFQWCESLQSLDLSHFSTDNASVMAGMFTGCSALKTLDLTGFNTLVVTNMGSMFNGCSALTTIRVGDGWTTWSLTDRTEAMFLGCTSLVGGRGTAYDPEHVDAGYARIDYGQLDPGSLTKVSGPMAGDVNDDGVVNSADVMAMAHHLVGQTPAPFNTMTADVNADNRISVADLTGIIGILDYDPTADKAKLAADLNWSKNNLQKRVNELSEIDAEHAQTDLWNMVSKIQDNIDRVEALIAGATTQEDILDCRHLINIIDSDLLSLETYILALAN